MTRDISIEPDPNDGFWVVEHGTYERSSVLAGQYRRSVLDHYDTVEKAVADYPTATVAEFPTASVACVADVAPSDFDPADAGEQW